MKKRTFLFVITVGVAVVAILPSTGVAVEEDAPLHLSPAKSPLVGVVSGGTGVLSTTGGTTVFCGKSGVSGTATFESGTTGVMQLNFSEAGETKPLPFHLLTLPEKKPGILITPNADGSFLPCGIFFSATGNGLIGTITSPKCEEERTIATIVFESVAHGVQRHKKVEGTSTEYGLVIGSTPAALTVSMTVSFSEKQRLICT
ncbi:MAG TPA: hypothetical protein VN732_06125 [Solirubrobacterales bacterium]|nr:hypothetical protein [Solirubrobacterales bacterium]